MLRPNKAEKYLIKADPVLGKLIKSQKLSVRLTRDNYFESLCRSIIGQQVSVAAANTIFARFEANTGLQPARVLNLSEANVKTIGLSRQKSGYLKDLARHFDDDAEIYNHLENLSDQEVIDELTAIKGIGVWTAQMFLISTLERPDVFAVDDLGLLRAIEKLYKIQNPSKRELAALAEKWSPHRTTASLHLWHSLSNNPN